VSDPAKPGRRVTCQPGLAFLVIAPSEESIMFDWLKRLFGHLDRQQNAADRAAAAMEGIADTLEQLRDSLRARLHGTESPPALECRGEPENGRRRKASV
jgi:hypothetical protein